MTASTDFTFEIVGTGEPNQVPIARSWWQDKPHLWSSLTGLSALDLYLPIEGGAHDPFNNDGPGPAFIAMLIFASRDALKIVLHSTQLATRLRDLPAGLTTTGSSFERHFYPVAGEAEPASLTAPFSYVVRYHKPAEDEAAFIRNYIDTHPPTLGTLPGIRSVMCYFPQNLGTTALAAADYLIGNEVAFDDVAAFNAAMQSPVRQELRRHFRAFPPFTGRNTHFPMNRTRLAG